MTNLDKRCLKSLYSVSLVRTKMIVGTVLVIIGLLGIVLITPMYIMGRYGSGYSGYSTTSATATLTTQTSIESATQYEGLSMDQAKAIANHYLDSLNNPDLAIKEIMEFEYNFYIIFYEKSTGVGAFEMLVWKVNPSGMNFGMPGYGGYGGYGGAVIGSIMPEPGPNMMWNTKYGGMMGQVGGGMMGGGMMGGGMMGGGMMGGGMMGGGMMGGGMMGQYQGSPTANMPINDDEARRIGQQYLDRYFPGATIEMTTKFYGYYTFDFEKDGKIQGMFSVNGYTGQTWYHGWHGTFIREEEFMSEG
jgi:hypothetical protein